MNVRFSCCCWISVVLGHVSETRKGLIFSKVTGRAASAKSTGEWGVGGHPLSRARGFPGERISWHCLFSSLTGKSAPAALGLFSEKSGRCWALRNKSALELGEQAGTWQGPKGSGRVLQHASSYLLQSISCNSCLWFSFSFYSPTLCPMFQFILQPTVCSFIQQINTYQVLLWQPLCQDLGICHRTKRAKIRALMEIFSGGKFYYFLE